MPGAAGTPSTPHARSNRSNCFENCERLALFSNSNWDGKQWMPSFFGIISEYSQIISGLDNVFESAE